MSLSKLYLQKLREKPGSGPNRVFGPGDYLHRLILERFGIAPAHGCGCDDWAKQMNEWGADGCRKKRDEIVARMVSEAKKRHWLREGRPLLSAATRIAAATPWGLAYAVRLCGSLVDEAIAASEDHHVSSPGSGT